MDTGGYIEVTYRKMWAAEATEEDENLISVTPTSDDTTNADALQGGKVLPRPGTGTIEITDAAVQINTREDFTIKYTAATAIADAYLVVKIPSGPFLMPDYANNDDTQLVALTLTDGTTHPYVDPLSVSTDNPHPNGDRSSSRYGRVEMVSRLSNVKQTLHESDSGDTDTDYVDYDTVVWGPLFLKKGNTFTGRIRNVRITDTTGVHNWEASLTFNPRVDTDDPRPTAVTA